MAHKKSIVDNNQNLSGLASKKRKQVKNLQAQRLRRASRTRAKLQGTIVKPRLSVFRSNRYLYAQLIDDDAGQTLVVARGLLKNASETGETLAKKARDKNIKTVVFDKGRYTYHGRVKELADGARKGGLTF